MRIAALDLGSNSFHLLVVDAHADGTFVPLVREKEMLRLGDVVSRDGRISDAAAERAVTAVRRFRTLADGVAADEIVGCATSAIREADNGAELIDRIYDETGVSVDVISGRDEARLIFGAVRASVLIDPAPAICFDLGGGSLEVTVGDGGGLLWSTSVHLGVARLSAELVSSDPPSEDDLRRLAERLTATLAPVAEEVADLAPAMAIGSSGTLCDLARMVAARREGTAPVSVNNLRVTREELLAVHEKLLSMPAEERRRLPGLDPQRADLIPAGSTFALTALELFGLDTLTVSEWALREGIVLDAIGHHDPADWSDDPRAIRGASVLNLARRCNWDEAHSRQVARLATDLFDQLLVLHRLGQADRELLEHAALLHDIGEHVSVESHHKHTGYLIQHGRLRGFAPDEVNALAALARYHRRGDPKPSHEPFGSLDEDTQCRVTKLAAILRLADGLDRGHAQVVDGVDCELREGRVRVRVSASADCDVELWGARRKRALLERLFATRVEVVGTTSS